MVPLIAFIVSEIIESQAVVFFSDFAVKIANFIRLGKFYHQPFEYYLSKFLL